MQKAKLEILQDYDYQSKKERNLSFYDLLIVYIFITLFFLLTIPVIYIRNEIYYISRDISELRTKHAVLIEENRELEKKIEIVKLKYEILDPLSLEIPK